MPRGRKCGISPKTAALKGISDRDNSELGFYALGNPCVNDEDPPNPDPDEARRAARKARREELNRAREAKAKDEAVHGRWDQTVIIGFDAEWEAHPDWVKPEPVLRKNGEPRKKQPKNPNPMYRPNVILSVQTSIIVEGHDPINRMFWTRTGALLRGLNNYNDCPDRWEFYEIIKHSIRNAIDEGALPDWPSKLRVIAAAHWTRADLTAMADYFKVKLDFEGVHGSYLTLTRPKIKRYWDDAGHEKNVSVYLVDTRELVPATRSDLAKLGELHGYDKLDTGNSPDGTPYIEQMSELLQDNPDLYEAYALRDAEISARHVQWMLQFQRDNHLNPIGIIAPTLSSLAVRYLRRVWEAQGIDVEAVNGITPKGVKIMLDSDGAKPKWAVKWTQTKSINTAKWWDMATRCYHGGHAEAYHYGPTETGAGPWFEIDLSSAYTTALATIPLLDWDNARDTTSLLDMLPWQGVGCALVEFQFPNYTLYPCLPVVSGDGNSLIFPWAGESYCTGPELLAAQKLGATITIKHGFMIPWRTDGVYPYRTVIKRLQTKRAAHPKGSIENELYKQMGNALYGKTAQGLSGATVYDITTDAQKRLDPNFLTNPFVAAHTTGLVRAAVAEMINTGAALYVATDGVIVDTPIELIQQPGHLPPGIASAGLAYQRANLTGDVTFAEVKYRLRQVFIWASRGVATIEAMPGSGIKTAKRGVKVPKGKDENNWMLELLIARGPRQKYERENNFMNFPQAHRTNADLRGEPAMITAPLEFDMKRRLVKPRMVKFRMPDGREVEHLACDTVPWNNIGEFEAIRRQWDNWRRDHVLRTMDDWHDWVAYGRQADLHALKSAGPGLGQVPADDPHRPLNTDPDPQFEHDLAAVIGQKPQD